ncbi:MAG: hypothetical protein CMI52_03925 [Parcubacteria group bacterium]|nr:hypothetical protein [Parcubacteria group bacterium]|tara:strand:- start:719 stop:1363 length:645 start_codon:yes stop_codon:yes gene_type:complete
MYRAVADRVAVDLASLSVPLTQEQMREILESLHFKFLFPRIIEDLRKCAPVVQYTKPARTHGAPTFADCSSILKWAFGCSGIYLPRRSIQQREYGQRVPFEQIRPLDLVFTDSEGHNYFIDDPDDGVGHVGVYTPQNTVIHLNGTGLVEEPLSRLLARREFRGATRIIQGSLLSLMVLQIPPSHDIESDDDLKWLLLQWLPKIFAAQKSANMNA